MPANETIVAVPTNVEQQGELRKFLVRLVEKLDIVFGYRGNDPYVSISQLQDASAANATSLTKLEETVLGIIQQLLSENSEVVTQLVEALSESTDESIESLKSSATITDADDSGPTLTTPPTQSELQDMQDQIATNAIRFNDLLDALRATEIIAT
jgi:hypothetical protein